MAILLTLIWKELMVRVRSRASLVLNIAIPAVIVALVYYLNQDEKATSFQASYLVPIILSTANQNLSNRIKEVGDRTNFAYYNRTAEKKAECAWRDVSAYNITAEVTQDRMEAKLDNETVGMWVGEWGRIWAGVANITSSEAYTIPPYIGVHLTSLGQNGRDLLRPEDDIKIQYYLGQSLRVDALEESLRTTHYLILLALQYNFLSETNETLQDFSELNTYRRIKGQLDVSLEKNLTIMLATMVVMLATSHLCSRLLTEKSSKMKELLQMSGVCISSSTSRRLHHNFGSAKFTHWFLRLLIS